MLELTVRISQNEGRITKLRNYTRVILFITALAAVALLLSSCGQETVTSEKGHGLKPEEADRLVAEVTEDLEIVAGVTPETIDDLSRALTGNALEETRAGMEQDLAAGRYRKRDYRNISVEFRDYSTPIAQLRVDFDDFGYYVDAVTGAAQGAPTGEKKSFDISAIEEDGRWKIKGIFTVSTETTPRSLPEETITYPEATPPAETTPGTPAE